MAHKDIVVIGGSTGSRAVLQTLLSELPRDLPASLFIATHVPSDTPGYLADALARNSNFPVEGAVDGQPIERGKAYVAVPDHHLLVIDGTVRLGVGPRENMTRPAIDPLFRSAALSYGPRTVGIVLSGMLNDGASGLWAVKACGGTAIVQKPIDAEADQMPLAALETVDADAVVSAADLARTLCEIIRQEASNESSCPDSLVVEVEAAAGKRLGSEALRAIADPSALTCPACQGVLSEVRGQQPLRYRCQTGHAETAEVLASRTQQVDEAMRIALRIMEERVTLVARMARDARMGGRTAVAELYEAREEEYGRYATVLRRAALDAIRLRDLSEEQDS